MNRNRWLRFAAAPDALSGGDAAEAQDAPVFPARAGMSRDSWGDPLSRTGVGLVFIPAAASRRSASEHTKYSQCYASRKQEQRFTSTSIPTTRE